jgi:redox-sensitive bicupin YhaK (pirin superfamily)
VRDIVADPEYLDVTVEPGALFRHAIKDGYTAFAYIIGGEGWFDLPSQRALRNRELALFSSGDEILVRSGAGPVRFLFLSGKPIREPVAWRGPIVMNTQEELDTAFDEFRAGTFIRKRSGPFIRID